MGDRAANLRAALAGIAELGRIDRVSAVYESEPVGYRDQPDFWNLALSLATALGPGELHAATRGIEERLGRVRSFRNAPRLLDIDILIYDDVVLHDAHLEIPHPRMLERRFVLAPLAEIEPELLHPLAGTSMRDALARLAPGPRVRELMTGAHLLSTIEP